MSKVQEPSDPKLGINLFDIDRMEPDVRIMLLGGLIDLKNAIRTDKQRLDETCVMFTCDLLKAASICDIIRGHDRKAGDYPTRVYLKKVSVWERLAADAVLTLVVDGHCILNRKLLGLPAQKIEDDDSNYIPKQVL